MTLALPAISLMVAGSLAGVEVCVAAFMNPIFGGLPDDAGLMGRAQAARSLGRTMPFWYGATIALSAALLWCADAGYRWLAVSAGSFVLSMVMSGVLLVPINNRVRGWTAHDAPTDWSDQIRRWDHLHLVRIGVVFVGFASMAVGLLMQAGGPWAT